MEYSVIVVLGVSGTAVFSVVCVIIAVLVVSEMRVDDTSGEMVWGGGVPDVPAPVSGVLCPVANA